jgi:inorganic pyrophosphatase
MASKTHDLTDLKSFDKEKGCWLAVIETPKDSHHKYDYEPKLQAFQLKKTLPEGMTFPLDFGFVPSTRAGDGDPVDILVLLDFPATMGAVVHVRLLGGIKAEQKGQGEDWARNDRLIAVAGHSKTLADLKTLDDLRPQQLDQLIEFFEQYNKLEGKKFRHLGNCDAKEAAALLRAGMKKAKKRDVP